MLEGPGADSEEKHEPVSDIDTGVVTSLKTLDPDRPIREADMCGATGDVRFGPCVDGSWLARTFFTLQHWSVRPCVRPVRAVLMTAGHNALRGSGPNQKRAFD